MRNTPLKAFAKNSPIKHSGSKLHNDKYPKGHDKSYHQKPITAEILKKDIINTGKNIKRKIKHLKQDFKNIKKMGKLDAGATESKWAQDYFRDKYGSREKDVY